MNRSIAIIGANFGDEGKGILTDALVRAHGAPLVARFNGGAQAGHTVQSPQGRHVFGHVGAGTFAGANTYLSSKFIVNPLVLDKELKTLGTARVFVHGSARVSTLFDMALNTLVESLRDVSGTRHGSCGLGINETVTRDLAGYQLRADALLCPDPHVHTEHIITVLEKIRKVWVPYRLNKLRLGNIPSDLQDKVRSQLNVLNNLDCEAHAEDLRRLALRHMVLGAPTLKISSCIILEGAQGLGLDEFMGEFPYVTRSITGLPYAIIAASELNCGTIEPYYVTRAYCTRHGAGPLPNEGVRFMDGVVPIDGTNTPNQWQGTLRYAPLDLGQLYEFIWGDVKRGTYVGQTLGVKIEKPALAITCLDQVGEKIGFIDVNGELKQLAVGEFPAYVSNRLHISLRAVSHGPEAKDVTFL